MICAIYARKSTDQNIADEEKSVTRQIERARAYAARKGWTVAEAHVYADDGISGAEFLKRPGFLRLMNALKPRAPFQVLIMSEESRLGREQIETAWALKQITDAGVRVFFYLEDRERTLETTMDKVMLSLANFASEMEREKARLRTRDAMQRKAGRGHVAGGKVYGYRNVEVRSAGGTRDHVEREIVPAEAEVIRRIFREIVAGRGFAKIAHGLNADRIPSPTGRGWAMSSVRELVLRELYRGRIVYGKTRWTDRGGTKVKVRVPDAEWLVLEAPALRIVDEETWITAHARLARTRRAYGGGWRPNRPASGIESAYLLTGFLSCALCTGGMSASWRFGIRGARRAYYRCNTHRARPGMCDNGLTIPAGRLEASILERIHEDVLTPTLVEEVLARVLELRRERPDALAARRQTLTTAAGRLQVETQRLTAAIRMGGALGALVEALRAVERERADVLAQLGHLDRLARTPEPEAGVERKVRARLAEWSRLLTRHPEQARPIFRLLVEDRITMTPSLRPDGRWYEYAGRASYGRLLAGVLRVQELVPPG